MRIVLVLIITLIVSKTNAQKIYFSDTSNKWKYSNPGAAGIMPCNCFSQMGYSGQITINGNNYSILTGGNGQSFRTTFIREDTVLKKVFVRFDTTSMNIRKPDTFEHVLYDYNLQVGDTFRFSPDNGVTKFVHRVSAIDSVMIAGVSHKVWTLQTIFGLGGFGDSYFVIEGLGSSTEALYPAYPSYFEFTSYLYCFENKGANSQIVPPKTRYYYDNHLRGGDFDNSTSCLVSSVFENDKFKNEIKIYPQPAQEQLTIELPKTVTGELTVVDLVGKVVLHKEIDNQNSFTAQRNNLPVGMYLLKITDRKTKAIYNNKIVFY